MKSKLSEQIYKKFNRFYYDFSRLLLGSSHCNQDVENKVDLEHFRNDVFYKLALLFTILGLFPIFFGAYLFFQEDNVIAGVLELLSYFVVLMLLLSRRISISVKRYIFILCVYLLGLMLLFVVGPTGAGLIVIISAIILAACLLDKKQSNTFIFINLSAFLVISTLFSFSFFEKLGIYGYKDSWYVVAISTQCIGTLFVLIISNILSNIESKIKENERIISMIAESERSKAVLISNLPGMAYRCSYDSDWTMKFVSQGCVKLTGYAPESLVNNKDLTFNDLISPEYRKILRNEWERVLANKLPFRYEYEITSAGGSRKWVLELGEGIYSNDGQVEMLEGIILDISDRKEVENALKYHNDHDMWTGLYNRRYLENILKNDGMIEETINRALICINLSTVNLVSTTYGFYYSQGLIKRAAEMLMLLCTDNHQLFCTYPDQFIFYIKDYENKNELIEFCSSVINVLSSVLISERIGGGIGVIEFDNDNKHDFDRLLKNVLVASEKAIVSYDRDFGFCFYDRKMELHQIREEAIQRELLQITADENSSGLYLQFQPILNLKTNQICGFEALARLSSADLGRVSPQEFIPIAEKTKFIVPLGNIILFKALQFLNRLNENGYDTVSVSINISAIQLLRTDFISSVLEMIVKMQVNPSNIGIEITESVFASNYQEINKVLGELKDIGIKVSIDDFGTEYSSLARANELNVNCLKIDKYFADKLLLLNEDEVIVADMISIAHKLGYSVVAEGIEYEEQRRYLVDNGCDKIQGYLIAKPLDEEMAIELMRKHLN